MLYTNVTTHGGNFEDVLATEFANSTGVTIATGYTSLDVLKNHKEDFERIAQNGGQSRLLLGMAFYEGLSARKVDLLTELSTNLGATNTGSEVYVSYGRSYHGKIYNFSGAEGSRYYIGSSNFSRSGIKENMEGTIRVQDVGTQQSIENYLDYLFHADSASIFRNADIVV